MKKNIILFLVLLFCNCSISKLHQEQRNAIFVFEHSLGRNYQTKFDRILYRFEKMLLEHYHAKEVSSAYRSYISEMDSKADFSILRDTPEARRLDKMMIKSGFADDIWRMADSVNVAGSFYIKAYVLANAELISKRIGKVNGRFIDPEVLRRNLKSANLNGLFYKSIKMAGNYHTELGKYIETVDIAGTYSPPSMMIPALVQQDTDFNDYFIRRLIMINIFFHDLSW